MKETEGRWFSELGNGCQLGTLKAEPEEHLESSEELVKTGIKIKLEPSEADGLENEIKIEENDRNLMQIDELPLKSEAEHPLGHYHQNSIVSGIEESTSILGQTEFSDVFTEDALDMFKRDPQYPNNDDEGYAASEKTLKSDLCGNLESYSRFERDSRILGNLLKEERDDPIERSARDIEMKESINYAEKYKNMYRAFVFLGPRVKACWICNGGFADRSLWQDHILTHKQNKTSSYKKPEKRETNAHFQQNTASCSASEHKSRLVDSKPKDERPFECDHCLARFRMKRGIKRHMGSHTKPYHCTFCQMNFSESDKLWSHTLNKHCEFDQPFICPFCSKQYARRESIGDHLWYHFERKRYKFRRLKKSNLNQFKPKKNNLNQVQPKENNLNQVEPKKNNLNQVKIRRLKKSNPNEYGKCPICGDLVNRVKDHIKRAHGKKLRCHHCSQTFKDKRNVLYHVMWAHFGIKVKTCRHRLQVCYVCGKKVYWLKDHIRRSHSTDRPYTCDFCLKTFKNKYMLKVHIYMHTGNEPYPCKICQKGFPTPGTLKRHERMHDGKPAVPCNFKCTHCIQAFSSLNNLNHHLRRIGLPKIPKNSTIPAPGDMLQRNEPYKCSVCGKNFPTPGTLENHAILHLGKTKVSSQAFSSEKNLNRHQKRISLPLVEGTSQNTMVPVAADSSGETSEVKQNENAFPCKHCGKSYSSARRLSSHCYSVHQISNQKFSCDMCPKWCFTKSNITDHILKHLGIRSFVCETCGKNFLTKDVLHSHQQTHRDDRRFKCSRCGVDFPKICQYRSHMGEHEGLFTCDTCQKVCKGRRVFRQHLRSHLHQRIYQCPKCNLSFKVKRTMENHMTIHTGYKRFSCSICNYGCIDKYHLKIHLRRHNGEKPYKCTHCIMTYVTRTELKQHLIKIHKLSIEEILKICPRVGSVQDKAFD